MCVCVGGFCWWGGGTGAASASGGVLVIFWLCSGRLAAGVLVVSWLVETSMGTSVDESLSLETSVHNSFGYHLWREQISPWFWLTGNRETRPWPSFSTFNGVPLLHAAGKYRTLSRLSHAGSLILRLSRFGHVS